MQTASRRQFLGGMGWSLASAAVGLGLTGRTSFAGILTPRALERLRFGALDPLVDWLQATPADAMLPEAVARMRTGTTLTELVAAAALANARAHGGTNYQGFHTLMAMVPSLDMAAQMPAAESALPVLKVLHRNARVIQEAGRAKEDALAPVSDAWNDGAPLDLVASMRAHDVTRAERSLEALEGRSPERAYAELQTVVRDEMNVHRVVLAWRVHDLQRLTGPEHAEVLLRQSVRFCIDEDERRARSGKPQNDIVALLPELMERHHLRGRPLGTRAMDEAAVERLSTTFFGAESAAAAAAAAEALAKDCDPEDVGRALSLAATRLLLHDPGLKEAQPGKPIGSVHGASTGVHASDAANAWRHIARVVDAESACASLIAGAYHTAGQSQYVGAQPHDQDAAPCTQDDPAALLGTLDGCIRERDQKGACQAARRYTALAHPPGELFRRLLVHAVSEDGALHAEKYFRTAQEEHAAARPAHQPLFLVALTRVMASQQGFPAPGYDEARGLLGS